MSHITVPSLQAAKTLCHISGWSISNLKLQKLLYVAHMLYAGRYGVPMVGENFQAWLYGPVLPSVYDKARIYGIDPVEDRFFMFSNLEPETLPYDTLLETFQRIGAAEGWQLSNATHSDRGAWRKNFKQDRNRLIPFQDILDEYNIRAKDHDPLAPRVLRKRIK